MPTQKQAIYWELLAVRCQRGDAGAFRELVSTWERPLLYYIRRLLGPRDVEWDVLQEVWLRVFRGIGGLREHRRRDTVAQINVIFVSIVLLETVTMYADGLYPEDGLRLTVFGMVFLIGVSVMLLRTVIEQSELPPVRSCWRCSTRWLTCGNRWARREGDWPELASGSGMAEDVGHNPE